MPIEPAGVVSAAGAEETIAFERAYVREGFSGGPVAHIFESQSTLVGMTVRVDNSRVLVRPIHVLLRRAQAWDVPVLLIAPGTELGCQYRVHPLILHLSAARREAVVNVDTTGSCRWSGTRAGGRGAGRATQVVARRLGVGTAGDPRIDTGRCSCADPLRPERPSAGQSGSPRYGDRSSSSRARFSARQSPRPRGRHRCRPACAVSYTGECSA